MSRPAKNYRLWKNKQTGYYYWKVPGGPWRSTKTTTKTEADRIAQDKWRVGEASRTKPRRAGTVGDYVADYFDWQRCPRIADRRAEGKRISKQHAARQRRVLEKYITPDPVLMSKPLRAVLPDDVRAFRQRLMEKLTPRVLNSVTVVVKTIFRDLLRRGLIDRDASAIIGRVSYEKKTRGIFTEAELGKLFAEIPGFWGDTQGYVAFLMAATCGLRRGEVLAIRWRHLDLDKAVLHVKEAWKDTTTTGEPKWGQVRSVRLTTGAVAALRRLRRASEHVLPDGLVLCDSEGGRRGEQWWQGRFAAAMKVAKIDAVARRLSPHSFRHTLATLWREKGVADPLIKAALGWSEGSATIEDYSHLAYQQAQADIIGKIVG